MLLKLIKNVTSTMVSSPSNITRITVTFGLNLLNTAVNLAAPYAFVSALADEEDETVQLALFLYSSYAIGWGLGRILPYIRNMLLHPMGTELAFSLTNKVMEQYYALPMEYRASNTNAPAVQHFGAAYEHIGRTFITNLCGAAIPSAVEVIAVTCVTAYFYHQISLVFLGISIVYAGSLFFGAKVVGKAQNNYIANLFEGYEYIIAQLDQYENAHYYGNIDYEINNLRVALGKLNSAYNTSLIKTDTVSLVQTVIVSIGFIGISILAGHNVLKDSYKNNDYVWIVFYTLIFSNALSDLARSINLLYGNYANFKELQNYLDKESELNNKTSYRLSELKIDEANIVFENVTFSYKERKVLANVSFEVPAHKTTVVVGLSGQGKSTILKLLLGFYKPQAGNIKIAGNDIEKFRHKSIVDKMAIVPQSSNIFSGTLFENIKYGNLDANKQEVYTASECAGLNDFTYKYGFDASVGEKGAKLSGGQKQRISIARAYLRKDSPYLVLDEPTSSLDPQTEEQVLQNLNELIKSQKKTTLLITHKLNTVNYLDNVDNVIVLNDGTIAEKGTVSELLSRNGIFAKQMSIANKQFKLYKEIKQTQSIPEEDEEWEVVETSKDVANSKEEEVATEKTSLLGHKKNNNKTFGYS
ncbi:MAG: hypothetical protein Tsb005_21270 [Gammaproteobacteria bacterium]